MKKITVLFLLAALLCCGCSPSRVDTPQCRIVTQIHITREQGEDTVSRCYTDPESMSAILSYLRRLKPYTLPSQAQPEAGENCYRITLDYSDGTQHNYQQQGNRLFRDSSGKWKQIDEELGKSLTLLFEELPSEQIL